MNQLILRAAKSRKILTAENHFPQRSEIPDPCKNRGPRRATGCASLAERQFSCVHSGGASLSLRNTVVVADALGLHNVLWMIKNDSRIILSWNNNLTKEETKKYTVKYILIYKFFNTTKERKVSSSEVAYSLK